MRFTATLQSAEIEMRVPRLVRAVIAAHMGWKEQVRERADDFGARELLRARIEELDEITARLPQLHPLRMAAEHAVEVHERWAEDSEGEALMMTLSCALLSRVLDETSYAFRVRG